MDSSKSFEECSSSESGWTRYIASSPEHNNDDQDEADEDSSTGHPQEGYKKDAAEDVDSDDSMASDASSGPSTQYGSRGLVHARKKDVRKYVGKKQEEKKRQHEQIKADKDKHGNRANSAGRSKKA